jgi:8-oxo-dGTP pyrophosphatase MutT (NUDIX family)
MTTIPLPASTVVLLRQHENLLEVFMVRRHEGIPFMGGAHVFPGGRVEPGDSDRHCLSMVDGIEAITSRITDVDPMLALGFCVAAVRETFEEAGILLARDTSGQYVTSMDFTGVTTDVTARDGDNQHFIDVLRRHNWRIALDALEYFAHWVTPAIESRRFDTRFFVAAAPREQVAAHDRRETTAGVWIRPADALAQCRRGDIGLPPPTWTTLRWLEEFESVAETLEWARRNPVPRIEPGFIQRGEARLVLLPGDDEMPSVEGFEARETRFLLSEGRWIPVGG